MIFDVADCRHAAACGRLGSVCDENFDVVDEHMAFDEERERREKPVATRPPAAA